LTPSVKWAYDPTSFVRRKSKKTKGLSNAFKTLCEGFIYNLRGFGDPLNFKLMKIIN